MQKLEKILICPDVHIPYQSEKGWKLFLKVAKEFKPDHLVVIGDFLDFYAVSSHSKNPKRANKLDEEIEAGKRALDQLDALKVKNKYYIAGNHCDRLQRYLQDKAPELFSFISVPELLGLKKRGWKYVPYRKGMKLGKLHLTHDVGAAGRYAVYKCLDTYQHSIVTGHTHRLAYIVEGNAVGEFKLSAQFGWLGDAEQVDYMQQAKVNKDWALGFGIGYLDPKTGIVYLQPVPIINYSCVVNGKIFKE